MSTVKFTNKKTGKSVSFTPKPGQVAPIGGFPIKKIAYKAPKKSVKKYG